MRRLASDVKLNIVNRSVTPLKTLQGWIGADSYTSGKPVAPLYVDVLPAFWCWQQEGIGLLGYSSGSVEVKYCDSAVC